MSPVNLCARCQTARTASFKGYVDAACQLVTTDNDTPAGCKLHAYGKGCCQLALPAISFTRRHRGKIQNAPHVSLLLHDRFLDLLLSGLHCQTCCE